MRITIQSWNDQYLYEFKNEDGEILEDDARDTLTACFARCLELLVKLKDNELNENKENRS